MTAIILVSVYLCSIIGCWLTFRIQSPKYLDNWLSESCKINVLWFVPILNSVMTIMILIIISEELTEKLLKNRKLPKSKWLNTDL